MSPVITLPATPTHSFIWQLFDAFRQKKSVFAVNPKLPVIPKITHAPPRSLLLMTSGSTAKPKIAVLSFESLLANAEGAVRALDLKRGDLWRLTLPLYHVGGMGILLRCHLSGAKLSLEDHPDITHLSYVPTHLYRMSPVYKKLKCLLLGGAPIHHIPSYLPICTTYGLTEMGSMVTLNGDVLPNRELKLSPDGEILVKGPTLFTQYIGEEPQQGWFATRDLGRFENGKLLILGRKDWMFISGGENIQPEEIEKELLSLPFIEEAVIVAKEDPEFGKRPVAIIKSDKNYTLTELHDLLSKRLPRYKLPIDLYFFIEKQGFKINRFFLSQYINSQLLANSSGQKKGPAL